MISRRQFLRGILGTGAATVTVTSTFGLGILEELSDQQADSINSRAALAQAMVEPIRRSLEYQAVRM